MVYCKKSCQIKHWGEHKEECWEAISDRVGAGDVHKDDAGGEYVLGVPEDCKEGLWGQG